MKLKRIDFDDDGDVDRVTILIESDEELVFITDTTGPEGLVFPVSLSYSADDTCDLFHRAGKVPGNVPQHAAATEIFCVLLPIVDRLIEYDL